MAPEDLQRDRMLAPLRSFIDSAAFGSVLLLLATVTALVWSNSPWADGYEALWHLEVRFGVGPQSVGHDLHYWVNDALMAVFFFVVGLEIKREVLIGELATVRRAALPVAAALGGAVAPALIYLALVGPGSEAARGWGVPMATDIAFALGVLAVVGGRLPSGLRLFLTALAIVDDLIAVLVIAAFYSTGLNGSALAVAGAVLAALMAASVIGVRSPLVYAVLGVALWAAVSVSGLHATLAGILLAAMIPARPRLAARAYLAAASGQLSALASHVREDSPVEERHAALWELEDATVRAQAPMLRMEHALQPWVAYVIVPLFALANAGVALGSGVAEFLSSPVVPGIVVGLVLGKQLGITAATWLTVRLGAADLPDGVRWRHIYGAAWIGGIGFTMSLFVAELAFTGASTLAAAKVGILLASIVAGVGGLLVLTIVSSRGTGAASDR